MALPERRDEGLQWSVDDRPGPATQIQKVGRMIVLQNQKRPLSTDFFIEKMTPFFFKTLTFEYSNETLILQNTDFHRVEVG